MASSFLRFLDHTQQHITVGRTSLDKRSARRSDLYLTTHNTHNRQTSMPLVGFEPTISASERQQTYTLDRAATGTGTMNTLRPFITNQSFKKNFTVIFLFLNGCERHVVVTVPYFQLSTVFIHNGNAKNCEGKKTSFHNRH